MGDGIPPVNVKMPRECSARRVVDDACAKNTTFVLELNRLNTARDVVTFLAHLFGKNVDTHHRVEHLAADAHPCERLEAGCPGKHRNNDT